MKMKIKLQRNESLAGWVITIILSLLVLAPLGSVLIQVFYPGLFFGNRQFGQLDLLLEVFKRPLWQRALQNSLLLSTCTAIMGTLLGTALAIYRSRWQFPTAKWLDLSVWILFITPSFIIAQGWVLFAAHNGVFQQIIGTDILSSFIFHPTGLVFIMMLSKFPLAYLAVSGALKWKVDDLSHAARLAGASVWRTWLTVHIPLLKPSIVAGAVLVFMDTIGDFGLPAAISTIYRFPTLPYAIYSAIYTSPIRFDMAGVLSFYLVLIILLAILVQFYIMKGARYDSLSARAIRTIPVNTASKSYIAMLFNLLFLTIIIGIPIGSTIYISFVYELAAGFSIQNLTLTHYAQLFSIDSLFIDSLLRSLKISSIAALGGLLLGLTIAYVLVFAPFRFKYFLETVSLISLAVPGVVLGIGYIFFWNQSWLEPLGLLLYGQPSILIVAGVAGAIPLITRIISGTIASIPRAMLDVAQLQGMSLGKRITYILLPLCKSAVVTAALSAFGASMFDLAVNSILFPTGHQTLPLLINKAFENFQFGYASAATISGGAIVTTIIVIINKIMHIKVRK